MGGIGIIPPLLCDRRQAAVRLQSRNASASQSDESKSEDPLATEGFVVALSSFVESQKSGVSNFIADQVKRWDLAQLTRLIEMNIGRDLQYIRFNGMVIGGLAGVVLHAVERLFLVD
jgi:uncharacterized membrane-anchored protein YjiN (DUF445 family)